MSRARLVLTAVVLLTAALSWFARAAHHRRVELPGRAGWITTDPDSQYQMRRVERAFDDGLHVAGSDERMNAPHGSPIPWPPYYTMLSAALLKPFAPDDSEARHAWIERALGTLPLIFGVLGSVLAALAARRIAGDFAAAIAGVAHASCYAAVAYARVGNADHNAFVSLVSGALLFAFARALEDDVLDRPRRAALWGVGMGLLAGVALGAWVASLMYVVQAQLAFGILLLAHSRKPRAGVPALGLTFHLAALVASLPAVLASPWRDAQPWMVVNLSWFHPAFLALGAAVFAPLVVLRAPSRITRAWPWIVLVALTLLGAIIAFLDIGPAGALRESFAWVGRTDAFMARVGESRPLIGAGTGDALFEALGYSVLALPFAWIALAAVAWKGADLRLIPWCVAVALLAAQATRQARFAEALALPMAVVLGWAAARSVTRWHMPRAATLALVPLLALGNWDCLAKVIKQWSFGDNAVSFERPSLVGVRAACEWIATQPRRAAGESVMAVWSSGHAIEWAAGRASVATNFGSYLGLDGFSAPMRFFMCEDLEAADVQLAEHHSRFVLVASDLPNNLNNLIEFGAPERRERYVAAGTDRVGTPLPGFFLTLGARLMFDGAVFGPLGEGARPLDRLRLVWIAPFTDPKRVLRGPKDVAPAAWVWERVAGALVEAHGTSGNAFELALAVDFVEAKRRVVWHDTTHFDASGIARVRIPYATQSENGAGRAAGPAQWRTANAHGELEIPESAVRDGSVLRLP